MPLTAGSPFGIRHEPLEQATKEQREAIELGKRLFRQLAFPLPLSPYFNVRKLAEAPFADDGIQPHSPALLRLLLEITVAGCDWLLARLSELIQRLKVDRLWLSSDPFKMVRLMGKHAIDMADDLEVVRVFLSSVVLFGALRVGPDKSRSTGKPG